MYRFVFTLLLVLVGVTASHASASKTRLVVHVDQEQARRTHLVGSPFQIMVSVVNHEIELREETRAHTWREESSRVRGLPKPGPVDVTDDLLVDLGETNTAWFDAVELTIRKADGGREWFAGTEWSEKISFPFAIVNEPTKLGREPRWVTLEVSPEMSQQLEPGLYVVSANSPLGADSWEFEVRSPRDQRDNELQAHRVAKWELAYRSADRALELAEVAALGLVNDDPEVLLTRGRVHAELGNYEQALTDVESFLGILGDAEKPCFLVESARRLRNDLISQVEED